MTLESEKHPFDNRKFILPTSRYIGTPPWSSRSPQVAYNAANVLQELSPSFVPEVSPLNKVIRFIWNLKVRINF